MAPPSLQAAGEESPPGGRASMASSSSDTPYASWQVHYEVRCCVRGLKLLLVLLMCCCCCCRCSGAEPGALSSTVLPSLFAASATALPCVSRFPCSLQFHYAPLASDLAKYGREALKGAAAAACRPHPPIQPFAQ